MYASQLIFTVTITLVKLSILLFYTSLFPTKRFVQVAWATMALCVAWMITFIFVLTFICIPIHAFWDIKLASSPRAHCQNLGHTLIPYEVTNIAIDILILSLPIFKVKRLHLPTSKRVGAGCIFLLGGLVIAVSIVRICYLGPSPTNDIDNRLPTSMDLSTAELAVALVCASVPAYGIYFQAIGRLIIRAHMSLNFKSRSKESPTVEKEGFTTIDDGHSPSQLPTDRFRVQPGRSEETARVASTSDSQSHLSETDIERERSRET